jgi:hypothetical protein
VCSLAVRHTPSLLLRSDTCSLATAEYDSTLPGLLLKPSREGASSGSEKVSFGASISIVSRSVDPRLVASKEMAGVEPQGLCVYVIGSYITSNLSK